jgi:hypothetical protein
VTTSALGAMPESFGRTSHVRPAGGFWPWILGLFVAPPFDRLDLNDNQRWYRIEEYRQLAGRLDPRQFRVVLDRKTWIPQVRPSRRAMIKAAPVRALRSAQALGSGLIFLVQFWALAAGKVTTPGTSWFVRRIQTRNYRRFLAPLIVLVLFALAFLGLAAPVLMLPVVLLASGVASLVARRRGGPS